MQVPTSLLAMVDSSWGKTGINLPEGKNLVVFISPRYCSGHCNQILYHHESCALD